MSGPCWKLSGSFLRPAVLSEGRLKFPFRVFPGQSLSGSVDPARRILVWAVANGCEAWSGTLTVAADVRSTDRSLLIDRSGCPPDQAAMGSTCGTLSLSWWEITRREVQV
jgi:hypothetical protein